MKKEEHKNLRSNKACSECDDYYIETSKNFEAPTPDDGVVIIPNFRVLQCKSCGDELIPSESLEQITKAIAEATEQLTAKELNDFLETYNLTQKEAAEILGLGEKTVHRWTKGIQVVSRSMGYYIRVLEHFPKAFEWLKRRDWKNESHSNTNNDNVIQFPALRRARNKNTSRNAGVSQYRDNPIDEWSKAYG